MAIVGKASWDRGGWVVAMVSSVVLCVRVVVLVGVGGTIRWLGYGA